MTELSISHAARDPEIAQRPALIVDGEVWSYGALASRVARMREAMAREGVAEGSRVAILAKNAIETAIAIHASIEIGATIVPVHPRLTDAEAAVILADAAPALVLREHDLARLANRESRGGADASSPSDAMPLAMVYTSGTTGRPKGAVLSRRAFLASARGSARNLGWEPNDAWLCAMPLCHVGGLSILTRSLVARRAMILEPRFDADRVLTSIVRDHATMLSVVPTMLSVLLERDTENVLARLRVILVGGAATPMSLLEACARRGLAALTTYGLTEACSQVTVQTPTADRIARRGSGEPLDGVEVRIAREDGTAVNHGEVGRILVRGTTLMDGYFRGPDRELDARLDREGFFDTGDLGERDPRGALFVHTRRTDLIVTGGENVYPVEIEQHLEGIAGVRRALVFGVPDDRWGQVVAAVIEADASLNLSAVNRHVETRLASHKRPRRAAIVASLPLTASGKVERSRAVERFGPSLRPLV